MRRRRWRAVPAGVAAVFGQQLRHAGRRGQIDRRCQQFQNEPAGMHDPGRSREYRPSRVRPLWRSWAPAPGHRRLRQRKAGRRSPDEGFRGSTGWESRPRVRPQPSGSSALRYGDAVTVDRQRDHGFRPCRGSRDLDKRDRRAHSPAPFGWYSRSRLMADSTTA